jgi:hypothetical protein
MSPIPCIGLAELIILSAVTGLACGVPLILSVFVAAVVISQREPHPVEQE